MPPEPQSAPPGADAPLVLDFDDNTLLSALFGEHDRYLARIEQKLDVTLVPRGNRVAIQGGGDHADVAAAVLRTLYGRLRKGHDVGLGDVDGAIRIAEATVPLGGGDAEQPQIVTSKRLITSRSLAQTRYIQSLNEHELVFALGPAGTGKTYLAVAVAVAMLMSGKVERIVLSRPAVEAGERLGFLPGDMREKVDPYLRPLYDALFDMLPANQVARRMEAGEIEVAPLAFMRGRTLANAYVILDEAQNTTPVQIKMFLTRIGENSRMVVTGDPSQVDLAPGVRSGLSEAVRTLADVEGVDFVRFSDADVVRHPLVTRVVQAYEARTRALRSGGDGTSEESGR